MLIKILQNWDVISTVITLICTACSGGAFWAFKVYKKLKNIYYQLVPNGGSSLADKINQIFEHQLIGEMRQQIVWANLEVGYYECDKNGECVYVNKKLSDLFGLPKEQMLGMGWLRAVRESQRNIVWENWKKATVSNVPYDQSYEVINQLTGESYQCRTTAYTCYNSKKEPIYFFGTVTKSN